MQAWYAKCSLFLACIALLASDAQAAPIFGGQSISAEFQATGFTPNPYAGPVTVIANPAVGTDIGSFPLPNNLTDPNGIKIDFGDDTITINFVSNFIFGNFPFNGPVFNLTFPDDVPDFENAFISAISPGAPTPGVSFTANSISLNFSNLSFSAGQSFTVQVEAVQTPEPASLALWVLGAAGMAALARARRRSSSLL